MVLGAIVEQLYGKPYRDVIRDEIARPLGLTTLDWCTMKDKRPTDTIGHVRSPQGVLEPAAEVGDVALGGGLCATAGDLARWNLALHGGRVLSPASYTAMITPRGAAESERYGFGIRVLQSPSGAPILTHDGNTITFVAENAWYPAEALSVTVLYNSPLGVGTSPMGAHLARIAMGEAVPDTVPTAGVANPESLVGFYEGRPGRGFAITLEGGTLYVQPTGNSKVTLMQQAGTTYAADAGDATLTFTIGADGRATGLIFRAGPREQIFPKVR
jgi:CubicO group peptidase (beta-lactamase class C family)